MPPDYMYMDYGKTNAVGQATHDAANNLALTWDQNAPGATDAARAFPAWATSQATLDVHAAHGQAVDYHVQALHAAGNGIQASVPITRSADATAGQDAAAINSPGGSEPWPG